MAATATETPPTAALPDPLPTAAPPRPEAVLAELDASLVDALRRATTQAERFRLTRMRSLLAQVLRTPAA